MRRIFTASAVLVAAVSVPSAAQAFCGFYVSGGGAELFNNATQVVMMRKDTRTVLSMQNNYQGPPENFAMVVPVPVVLQKENVKTLPTDIFARVDKLGAPRLVEYWEEDPCHQIEYKMRKSGRPGMVLDEVASGAADDKDLGVKIEAQFKVGEYDIVILSAKDSTGLETWLKQEKYSIPEGAAPYLKPYVEGGSKFFVAKVDVKKVKFENNQAMLSPLRFHYDSKDFNLPIRLGMMNSSGTQDLIVNILAKGQRFEVANYANVTIPTNLDVKEAARDRFGEFYAALFDRTLEKNPKAVVTEYSWDASSCDPCPEPALNPSELATLGADVLGEGEAWGFVLTRLHARYSKDGVSEDLVFKSAPAIAGGREWRGPDGKLEEGKLPSPQNNFQGRYAIRHEWTGPIECENPVRGRWGGPPSGTGQVAKGPQAATDLAFVPRGKMELAKVVRANVPEIGLTVDNSASAAADSEKPATGAEKPATGVPGDSTEQRKPRKEKKGCQTASAGSAYSLLWVLVGLLAIRRRRKEKPCCAQQS